LVQANGIRAAIPEQAAEEKDEKPGTEKPFPNPSKTTAPTAQNRSHRTSSNAKFSSDLALGWTSCVFRVHAATQRATRLPLVNLGPILRNVFVHELV
jgi:hypothetical protein